MATALGQIVPFYYIEFATTALRLANTFTADQIGRCSIRDGETGKVYSCIAPGSGVTCMAPIGSYQSSIVLPLMSFRECSGSSDVGDIAANGGVLASDTTPILRGRATVNNQEISWAKLYKRLQERAFLLAQVVMVSWAQARAYLSTELEKVLRHCRKHRQRSRLTTLEILETGVDPQLHRGQVGSFA